MNDKEKLEKALEYQFDLVECLKNERVKAVKELEIAQSKINLAESNYFTLKNIIDGNLK